MDRKSLIHVGSRNPLQDRPMGRNRTRVTQIGDVIKSDIPVRVIPTGDGHDEEYLLEMYSWASKKNVRKALAKDAREYILWTHRWCAHDPDAGLACTIENPKEITYTLKQARRIVRMGFFRGMHKAHTGKTPRRGACSLLPMRYDARADVPSNGHIPGACLKDEQPWDDKLWHAHIAREWARQDQAAHDEFMYATGTWAWGAEDIGVKYMSEYDESGEYIGDVRIAERYIGQDWNEAEQHKWDRLLNNKHPEGEIALELNRQEFVSYSEIVEAVVARAMSDEVNSE